MLSLKPLNTIISLLTSNLSTGSKSHNECNTKFSLTYKSLQFKQPSSILNLLKLQPTHSTRSLCLRLAHSFLPGSCYILAHVQMLRFLLTYLLSYFIHSCHPPMSFQSISAQNYWQILLPKLLLSGIYCPIIFLQYNNNNNNNNNNIQISILLYLLKPTTLFSHCLPLNSTNNSWKPTFSFNTILPRPSPPRLTLWNSTQPDLNVIHTPFHLSFISTSFIVFSFYTWCQQCSSSPGYADSEPSSPMFQSHMSTHSGYKPCISFPLCGMMHPKLSG